MTAMQRTTGNFATPDLAGGMGLRRRDGARELVRLTHDYENALVYVTLACNLRCPRCFLSDLDAERRRYMMTRAQFERILVRLREQNLRLNQLQFTGGEPTLWPDLRWAIRRAKETGIARHVRVSTNAVGRSAADFEGADRVVVSHYGGINRDDIGRLRRQLGRRLSVICVVHLDWPFPEGPDPACVPADCNCVQLSFLGDRVYPCGFGAARGTESVSVEENFYARLCNGRPREQVLCQQCLSNRRYRFRHLNSVTCELGVWDSNIMWQASLGGKFMRLRALYRRWWGTKKGA